ncbi:MAG: glycosyltransferase family 39 protein [Calothrix sp. C42_A2020_038]|nr:glycosyltransferase family 39 protein [Calothrix sp. C42_A2020_038]
MVTVIQNQYNKLYQKNNFFECIFIFLICFTVYLSNGMIISASDTIPNTLLTFNWLENHTFNFDAFKNDFFCPPATRYSCYFFTESKNGHLVSTYPIGTAIITLPLYIIYYIYLKCIYYLGSAPLDLTSSSFEIYRVFFEKLTAALITAITVSIFYLSTRIKFSRSVSLLSTFIFAFATNCWMTSSQGLWQHTASNFALVLSLYCLFKANQIGRYQKIWLVIAGVAFGLLPSIRPTSTLYTIAAITYSVFTYRSQSIFLFYGLISILPGIIWNWYNFSNLTGGYTKMITKHPPYKVTSNSFTTAFFGTLISPSRGLLIYSPIVLYSLPGVYKVFQSRAGKDEKLIGCMTIAAVILIVSYCFSTYWSAGYSYGPRFMTDILPIACYLIAYFVQDLFTTSKFSTILSSFNFNIITFTVAIVYSLFVQFVGAFGANPGVEWNSLPLIVDKREYRYRLWSVNDSQIERHARAVFHKVIRPPVEQSAYIQGLSGKIQQITDGNQTINSPISVNPGSKHLIIAKLENTGTSRWFGYQSALEKGETRVRGYFLDDDNNTVSEFRLFVSGKPKQHERTQAFASVTFPQEPGTYQLVLDMVSEGVGEFPNPTGAPFYKIDVNVGNPQSQDISALLSQIFSQEIKVINQVESFNSDSINKIPLLITNKSNFIWSNTGKYPTNFSYRWLAQDGNIIVADGERTPLPFKLAPGESAAINAIIKTPSQPGKYTLVLTMVQESVAWFSDKSDSPQLDIFVTSKL